MPEEFMNSYEEIHSTWHGIGDALAWARSPSDIPCYECIKEPHYYRFGYFVGKAVQAIFWVFVGAILVHVL